MLGKGGRFYEPIRTINHFGQSDFRVLCHFGFGFFFEPPLFHNRVSLLQLINTLDRFTFLS